MRKALETDIPRLVAIEEATQLAPWTTDIFLRCLRAGYDCWVIEENRQVVAFVMMSSVLTGESHILNLCVDTPYQRRGYGRELLSYALSQAEYKGMSMAYLEVRRSNQKAITLYDKMGFVQIGERKKYYPTQDGRQYEDALVLAKELGVPDSN